ncbi:hypothetical protein BMW23_0574 [Bodo saltans virus]|uniref:Uncharacterized protein n=1 Tax=Bodo saltans virus TaxID=2024608 RepID=A0A2H4UUK9_9VIRU|nr:hypothetical protein QJ851_gp0558 [Bodo saltans virus]ATZ80621.1 hypothetical protein BMW23_0574 [Bodo saltans virus]
MEILLSVPNAPPIEEIKKHILKKNREKSTEMMYTRINNLCNKICKNYSLEESEILMFNDDEDNLIKIFFDDINEHNKILSSELENKGYNVEFVEMELQNKNEKYTKSYKMIISVKENE